MSYWMEQKDAKFFVAKRNTEAVENILEETAWETKRDHEGNIIGITFWGHNLLNDFQTFKKIAPFVKNGSYIEMEGEDDTRWRWVFENRDCREVTPTVSWNEESSTHPVETNKPMFNVETDVDEYTPVRVTGKKLRVVLSYVGDGLYGDYNPAISTDEQLLRYYVYANDGEDWVSPQYTNNAPTLLHPDDDINKLVQAVTFIWTSYYTALATESRISTLIWSRCETLSADDFPSL